MITPQTPTHWLLAVLCWCIWRPHFSTSLKVRSVQFSCSVLSDSLWPHEPQHARLPCLSPTPRAYSNSCPSSWWCHPTHSSSVTPSPLPSIFPSIRVFSDESVLCIRWPKYWSFSFSISLPMNIQDWFPLGWTGWISLQPKRLSRVFSNTTVQTIFSSVLSFLYCPTLTSVHDYWENHRFDEKDLCWQSNVSVFQCDV